MRDGTRRSWLVGLSLAALYLIWGSTYLVLRFMVEEFPPFVGNGIRFVLAGSLLGGFLLTRGAAWPTALQWWGALRIGGLMLVGGVGLVTVAEANGVGSGLAATAVAVMPIWAALWSGLFGRWPTSLEWAGMALGLVGVIILAGEGDFTGNPLGVALMIIAPVSWAFGSIISGRTPQAPGAMAVAGYMTAGGVLLLVLGFGRGERFEGIPDASGWMALLYLTFLGSIVTLSAYTYLLENVRPALATSYAYVNPIVAVVLGVTLGSEVLSGEALIALPLILAGVGLVAAGRSRTMVPEAGAPTTGKLPV